VSAITRNDFLARIRTAEPGATAPHSLADDSNSAYPDQNVLAAKLERVTEKAIDKTDEILSLPMPDAESPSFGAVLRAQNAAATAVLNTQVRVDETRFRAQRRDGLAEILSELLRREAQLAAEGIVGGNDGC